MYAQRLLAALFCPILFTSEARSQFVFERIAITGEPTQVYIGGTPESMVFSSLHGPIIDRDLSLRVPFRLQWEPRKASGNTAGPCRVWDLLPKRTRKYPFSVMGRVLTRSSAARMGDRRLAPLSWKARRITHSAHD
jgi:hypothetical protein